MPTSREADMTNAAQTWRYMPGFFRGCRVEGNDRFASVYPQCPPGRQGTVMAATHNGLELRVLWDGCKCRQSVDHRFLSVVK